MLVCSIYASTFRAGNLRGYNTIDIISLLKCLFNVIIVMCSEWVQVSHPCFHGFLLGGKNIVELSNDLFLKCGLEMMWGMWSSTKQVGQLLVHSQLPCCKTDRKRNNYLQCITVLAEFNHTIPEKEEESKIFCKQ